MNTITTAARRIARQSAENGLLMHFDADGNRVGTTEPGMSWLMDDGTQMSGHAYHKAYYGAVVTLTGKVSQALAQWHLDHPEPTETELLDLMDGEW